MYKCPKMPKGIKRSPQDVAGPRPSGSGVGLSALLRTAKLRPVHTPALRKSWTTVMWLCFKMQGPYCWRLKHDQDHGSMFVLQLNSLIYLRYTYTRLRQLIRHIYVYIYIHMYMYFCISIYIYNMYTCIHAFFVSTYVHVHTCVYVYVYMYI